MIEQALTEYMVNALWQLPLLASGAWLLLRMVRPQPRMQHRVWLAGKQVPQGLKPIYISITYVRAKARTLQKTRIFPQPVQPVHKGTKNNGL
jgi:hypothetical protein